MTSAVGAFILVLWTSQVGLAQELTSDDGPPAEPSSQVTIENQRPAQVLNNQVPSRQGTITSGAVPAPKPPGPPRTQSSFLPGSFVFLRMLHGVDNEKNSFGTWKGEVAVNAPASFYSLTSYTFKSGTGSQSEADLRSFDLSSFVFSPTLVGGLGLVGHFEASGTTESTAGRSGLYYRFLNKSDLGVIAAAPMVLLSSASTEAGRIDFRSLGAFLKGSLIITPSMSYTWSEKSKTTSWEVIASYRFWENLALVASSNSSNVTDNESGASTSVSSNNLGMEMRTSF